MDPDNGILVAKGKGGWPGIPGWDEARLGACEAPESVKPGALGQRLPAARVGPRGDARGAPAAPSLLAQVASQCAAAAGCSRPGPRQLRRSGRGKVSQEGPSPVAAQGHEVLGGPAPGPAGPLRVPQAPPAQAAARGSCPFTARRSANMPHVLAASRPPLRGRRRFPRGWDTPPQAGCCPEPERGRRGGKGLPGGGNGTD